MNDFSFDARPVALPAGASAGAERRMLRWRGRDVCGFTPGAFRPYLYPVYSPAGFPVTDESPADHPHHHSIWAGADHVHLHVEAAEGRIETYAYNFYVNDVFQGRAPGRIVETSMTSRANGDVFVVEQALEWRGPAEWGARNGRTVLHEVRTTEVEAGEGVHRIDITSRLSANEHDVDVGPTRHAWFNARVAPGMTVISGGTVSDNAGSDFGTTLRATGHMARTGPRFIDFSGPVGGGQVAGVTLAPLPAEPASPLWWFASAWGVITASPCRDASIPIRRHARPVVISARYLIHDGPCEPARLGAMLAMGSKP